MSLGWKSQLIGWNFTPGMYETSKIGMNSGRHLWIGFRILAINSVIPVMTLEVVIGCESVLQLHSYYDPQKSYVVPNPNDALISYDTGEARNSWHADSCITKTQGRSCWSCGNPKQWSYGAAGNSSPSNFEPTTLGKPRESFCDWCRAGCLFSFASRFW